METAEVCKVLHGSNEGDSFSQIETEERTFEDFTIDERRNIYARGGEYLFILKNGDESLHISTFTDPHDGFIAAEAVLDEPHRKDFGDIVSIEE